MHSLSPAQSHTLLALATYADQDTGECYPLRASLSDVVRRGARETSRALTDLQGLGLIVREGRGPGRSCRTRLLFDGRPAARQSQADVRPASPKTCGVPHPRRAAGRTQNPPPNVLPVGENPEPSARARAQGSLAERICLVLDDVVARLPNNDHGRPWPKPRPAQVVPILSELDPSEDLALDVAQEVALIVDRAGRAPNVTSLLRKKLAEAVEERNEVRALIASSLADADGSR